MPYLPGQPENAREETERREGYSGKLDPRITSELSFRNGKLLRMASGAASSSAASEIAHASYDHAYDITGFVVGVPGAGVTVLLFCCGRSVSLPLALTGSRGAAGIAATAQADFDIQVDGTSMGTMRFAAGGAVATFLAASPITLAAGNVVSVIAPNPADATLANVSFTLTGTTRGT